MKSAKRLLRKSSSTYGIHPYLSRRIAKWQVILAEYNIVYMIRKAMNVIADHLADHVKSPILSICQVKGKRQTKDEKLGPYQEYLSKLAREVEEIKFTHLGMEGKHFVDTLVTLTSMARIDFGHKVQPVHIEIKITHLMVAQLRGK
jgi:hypothetical protein